ncbi:MAG: hypoxanthine phosphoribosyltransferase [Phascolarctobacterium sp.]|uniref:hypoxanthine phosphoribosyltransferase n=1 Tax=Phascolarctobacterium sp. TaxID=2049039 RepID=UPI0026DAFB85|nr:hypoxanthine phosphoribosyltransferase [Phascolarctobacterium sp.]MDO4920440.1 hypoxanthine phosphoribosyltransferase [Phascolarctobacterium sp.]
MHDDIKTILLTQEQIAARVQEMGRQITEDYQGRELIVVVLLKGAAWFATDLTRAIDMPVRVDFMVASSYGNGTSTSGNVKVKLDISENIAGKDVLLVDDIIDSGVTFAAIGAMLRQCKPATLKTVALCDKAERRVNGLEADYVGFKIPDEFVVGYGLDYAGDYRNLPYIGVLKPAVYARK